MFNKKRFGDYSIINKEENLTLYNNRTYPAELLKSYLELRATHTIINPFYFYYIDEHQTVYEEDCISLKYKYKDEKFSIIHQLKKQNTIKSLSFGLSKIDSIKGYLFFGGIPNSEIERTKRKHIGKCKVNLQSDNWGCDLQYIIVNNKSELLFVNKYPTFFDVLDSKIIIPNDFFTFLEKNFFSSLINESKCSKVIVSDKNWIECLTKFLPEKMNITFIINNLLFNFNVHDLFTINEKKSFFNLITHSKYENQWIFGNFFFEKYITLFDYENNDITFYSENPFLKYNNNDINSYDYFYQIIRLYIINTFIILTQILFLMIIKFKNNKKQI